MWFIIYNWSLIELIRVQGCTFALIGALGSQIYYIFNDLVAKCTSLPTHMSPMFTISLFMVVTNLQTFATESSPT